MIISNLLSIDNNQYAVQKLQDKILENSYLMEQAVKGIVLSKSEDTRASLICLGNMVAKVSNSKQSLKQGYLGRLVISYSLFT